MRQIPDELLEEYRTDAVVRATLAAWAGGHFTTLQDALVVCVKEMSVRHNNLFAKAARLAETKPTQYIVNPPRTANDNPD